jgi:hypothetical protein
MNQDEDDEVYFSTYFIKPGRHDWIVRFTQSFLDRDTDLDKGNGMLMPAIMGKISLQGLSALGASKAFQNDVFRKKKAWEGEVYVHDFISGHRMEDLP